MKKCLLTLTITLMSANLLAQYAPNTRWPYINEHFQEGTIYFEGNKKTTSQLNVHLWGNVLHYVGKDGKILQSTDKDILRVEIGEIPYLFMDRQLMELIGEKNGNVLVKLIRGDFDAMKEGTGAYGASLNSSAKMDLTSLDLGGMDKPELAKMQAEKNDGREIPLVTEYFYVIGGQMIEARKGKISDYIGKAREAEWKAFQKTNKIKWKKEDSLLKILEFFTQKPI